MTVTVEVDVDLYQVDSGELIEELKSRGGLPGGGIAKRLEYGGYSKSVIELVEFVLKHADSETALCALRAAAYEAVAA